MKRLLLIASLVSTTTAVAQQGARKIRPVIQASKVALTVKTVPLHHLSSAEAVKLLSPYVRSGSGGVFEASPSIRAVTIRELPETFDEMMAVLATYDREPASVSLNFQLISAENSTTREASLAPLDSLLRGVLRFTGYRLLATSVASASENGRISQSLAGEDGNYSLTVDVNDLRVDGANASVHLNVMLWQRPSIPILSTGVTVPIGQTIVLGTTSIQAKRDSTSTRAPAGEGKALILTVRPQLVNTKR
jgi:hypothetical protein